MDVRPYPVILAVVCSYAPVVKWISHRPPEPGVEVRFLSGALAVSCDGAAHALDLMGLIELSPTNLDLAGSGLA